MNKTGGLVYMAFVSLMSLFLLFMMVLVLSSNTSVTTNAVSNNVNGALFNLIANNIPNTDYYLITSYPNKKGQEAIANFDNGNEVCESVGMTCQNIFVNCSNIDETNFEWKKSNSFCNTNSSDFATSCIYAAQCAGGDAVNSQLTDFNSNLGKGVDSGKQWLWNFVIVFAIILVLVIGFFVAKKYLFGRDSEYDLYVQSLNTKKLIE